MINRSACCRLGRCDGLAALKHRSTYSLLHQHESKRVREHEGYEGEESVEGRKRTAPPEASLLGLRLSSHQYASDEAPWA